MALSVYVGRAGTGKTQACFEHVKQVIESNPGEPILYIVPDSATYTIERSLAEFMPQGGFTTVRVVGFSRLAYQIFQSVGMVRESGLSDIGQKLLLRLIMKREQGKLELLGQSAKQPHFADVLQGLISECDSFRVDAADLKKGAEQVESMVLQRKLQELAHIMEAYQETLATTGVNTANRLEELMEVLPKSPLIHNSHVIVDGFHWFTPIQMELLYELFTLAKDSILTITLPPDLAKLQVPPQKLRLFGRPHSVFADVMKWHASQKDAIELVVRTFDKNYRFKKPVLESLATRYFNSPIKDNNQEAVLPVTVAYNRAREADAVCRQILEAMEQPNRRWRDITIMLRESETYGDILEKTLKRYEIPYFSDRRRPMVSHPLGEFLQGLLEVVRRNFDHDAVFRLLKTDFWPLTRSAVDELENYCLEFGIRDFMWLKDSWPYERKNRFDSSDDDDTYDEKIAEEIGASATADATAKEDPEVDAAVTDVNPVSTGDRLNSTISDELMQGNTESARRMRVNAAHNLIMAELRPFWEFAKEEHTGYEWCEELFLLMSNVGVPARLAQWATDAEAAGDAESAAAHEQMYKRVIALFDEIMSLELPDTMTTAEVALLLEEGLEEVSYSLVPPSLDHVMVTTVERGYTHESDIVFLMGLNDGVFPQRMGDEGLLKDTEREALKAAGVTLAEGALVRAFNENFLLYLACTRSREELHISYAGSDEEGAALESSLAIKRWQQLGYTAGSKGAPLTIPEGQEPDYIWRPLQSLSLLAVQMGTVAQDGDLAPIWRSVYDWSLDGQYREALRMATRGVMDSNDVPVVDREVVQALLFQNEALSGSVTRLEKYQQCPFAFYARYGLSLEERPIKQFGAPEIGIFLHESLRSLGMTLLKEKRQWRDIKPDEEAALCEAVVAEISKELQLGEEGDVYETVLQQRLESTLKRTVNRLTDWSQKSKFNTRYLEKSFSSYGGAGHWPAVKISLGDESYIQLIGQLDRVDEWQDEAGKTYGLVVDYKSGYAEVTASDVYYGLKLQLVTYLLALERAQRSDQIEPAALVYTYVKNPRISKSSVLTEEMASELVKTDTGLKNDGYFTDNVELLANIDETVVAGKSTPYVPIRISGNGTSIHGQDKRKTKSPQDFKALTDYAARVIGKAGQHILAGHFPVSPYNLDNKYIPCSYCQYKALCRFENTRNNYRYINKIDEDVVLAKMAKGDDVYEVDRRSTSGD